MSNEIKAFAFEGRTVRTIQDDQGNPLWVAKDVAEALGYAWNGNVRIQHVPEDWRRVTSVVTLRGDVQEMAVLTEQGLYFFLGRSDKSAALPFQKWIAGEVLPSIRKTGAYQLPGAQLDLFAMTPDRLERTAELLMARARTLRKLQEIEQAILHGDTLAPRLLRPFHRAILESRLADYVADRDQVDTATIFRECLEPAGIIRGRSVEMQLAISLKSHGFSRVRKFQQGRQIWLYVRP